MYLIIIKVLLCYKNKIIDMIIQLKRKKFQIKMIKYQVIQLWNKIIIILQNQVT